MRYSLLIVGLLAALGGCASRQKGAQPAGEAAAAPVANGPTAAPRFDVLGLLPGDRSFVAYIDVEGMRRTPFFAVGGPFDTEDARRMKELCGYTLHELILHMWLAGGPTGATGDKAVVVFEVTRDKEQVHECLREVVTADAGEVGIRDEGELTSYTSGPNTGAYVAWLTERTVLMTPGSSTDPTYLSELLTRASSVQSNADIGPLLGKVDGEALAWIVGIPPEEITTGESRPVAYSADVKWTTEFEVRIRLVYASEEEATVGGAWMSRELDEQRHVVAEPLSSALQTARVATEARTATFAIRLNEAQAAMVVGFLQGSLSLLFEG